LSFFFSLVLSTRFKRMPRTDDLTYVLPLCDSFPDTIYIPSLFVRTYLKMYIISLLFCFKRIIVNSEGFTGNLLV